MGRKYKGDSAVSFRLEENIPVKYLVVGTPEWLAAAIPPEIPDSSRIPVRSSSDLQKTKKYLAAAKNLGVDTESSGLRDNDGLDPVSPSSEVVLGQIGTRQGTYVIEPKLLPEFADLLQSEASRKILQNAVHDFRFLLAKYNITLVNMYCTMLAEQVLTAGRDGVGVGLANLVRKYPSNRLISKAVRSEFIHFSGRFTEAMIRYAARDVALLFPIFDAQQLLLKEKGLEATAKCEFDIIPATAEMGLVGVYAEERLLWQTVAYNRRKQREAEQTIFAIYNSELKKLGLVQSDLLGERFVTFNLKSPAEKRAALKRIGILVDNAEADTLLRLDHPIGKPLADWSGYTKVLDNYGEPLLARRHWHTGRIHPNFDQLGAGENAQRNGKDKKETIATGRFSSNFQQLPRPEKILDEVTGSDLVLVRKYFAAKLAEIEAQQKAA